MISIENGTALSPLGFSGSAIASGIKNNGQLDLSVLFSDSPCHAAAVFTKNQVVAAPVILDRDTLSNCPDQIFGVLTNSGNANAATGAKGLHNAEQMQSLIGEALGKPTNSFFVLSTGVIGVQLPMDKIEPGIAQLAASVTRDSGPQIAEAICTTDTFPKATAVEVTLPQGTITIGGMAKGAGMIHPDMATMLAVVTTDARIPVEQLKTLWQDAVNVSFNRISVDGDTSTNDTAILLANGASGIELNEDAQAIFVEGLHQVASHLAQQIVLDGEGASKFIEIIVSGTQSTSDAHQIANTIAISPLVKTAFAGSDANWGRIMMAAGRAGITFDQEQTTLKISNDKTSWLTLLADGLPTGYLEEDAAAIFAQKEIQVWLELSEGEATDTVWTCDLTHDYVSINADYRS